MSGELVSSGDIKSAGTGEFMNDELSPTKIETLKSRFRSSGCSVKELKESTFEIVSDDFPVRTHVYANPYYLQFSTQILAKPKRAVPLNKVRKFLCDINLKANFVKFTMETDAPDKQTKAWPILVSVKLVSGTAGGNYEASAISNLVLLWLQDIAELMASAEDFEIHPMMDVEKLCDD